METPDRVQTFHTPQTVTIHQYPNHTTIEITDKSGGTFTTDYDTQTRDLAQAAMYVDATWVKYAAAREERQALWELLKDQTRIARRHRIELAAKGHSDLWTDDLGVYRREFFSAADNPPQNVTVFRDTGDTYGLPYLVRINDLWAWSARPDDYTGVLASGWYEAASGAQSSLLVYRTVDDE